MGYIVALEIEQMDIEYDHRCMFDYLLIEGQRYCGSLPPPPIRSMNDEMTITFVNDETKPSKGFRARYMALEIGCGGTLKQGDPMMAITLNNLNRMSFIDQCLWEIRANKSFIVLVKFVHPESDNSINSGSRSTNRGSDITPPCYFNSSYIMVNDSDGSLITRFCPDRLPPQIHSTGNKLFITYVLHTETMNDRLEFLKTLFPQSNRSTQQSNMTTLSPFNLVNLTREEMEPLTRFEPLNVKNFYANYFFVRERNVCGRNLFSSTGIIRTPRFPFRYLPNRNCTWVIHVDSGLQVKLNVSTFQLEPQSEVNGQCYDYLEIRNGKRPDSPLIGKYCGNGPLPNIVSHSNYLFLRFISDPSMQNRGFELSYEAIDTGCGGIFVGETGTIESPEYPDSYFSNMNCEWKIRVAEGSSIILYIVSIDIEVHSTGHCNFDYLEFFDGESDSAHSFGKYCNSMDGVSKNVFYSSTNRMFIRFTTDASVNHGGFKLTYRTECNRTLTGRYGVIESPNYPFPHSHNMNCNWHILAPLGNNVTVSFTSLTLEPSVECTFDHVNISEAVRPRPIPMSLAAQLDFPTYPYNLSSKVVLCGNHSGNLPAPIQFTTNEIVINFRSDESRSIGSGFRLEWSAIGCGGEYIERPKGVISSPNYPNPYPREVECLWHIKAPDGNRVDLMVENLDVEYSKTCMFDYVQVFGGPDENSPSIVKLCDQATKMHVSSIGSYMTIKMVSDISMARMFLIITKCIFFNIFLISFQEKDFMLHFKPLNKVVVESLHRKMDKSFHQIMVAAINMMPILIVHI